MDEGENVGAQGTAGGNEALEGRAQNALGDFAADLGRFLGSVQNRATSWLDQRNAIADQLTQIRDTANKYLQQLRGAEGDRGARRGRPPGTGTNTTPPPTRRRGRKKRTMSPEARARIAEAQRKRWARQRKEDSGS